MPTADEFRSRLRSLLQAAVLEGKPYMEVQSGKLHRLLGGYPGSTHSMPVCCDVMRREMQPGDAIVSEPPSGKGATFVVRYRLPRM